MKKIIVLFSILIALSFVLCTATAETSVETILSWIADDVGEGEAISNVTLIDRVLSVYIDLSGAEELYPGYLADLADIRTSGITDTLLDHEDFDAEWDALFFSYEGIGTGTYTKADITVNEYGLRYIDVYNADGSTKMELVG